MEKKPLLSLEVEKNGRKYMFHAQAGSPLGECHDALYDCLQEVVKLMQEAMKSIEPKKPDAETQPN